MQITAQQQTTLPLESKPTSLRGSRLCCVNLPADLELLAARCFALCSVVCLIKLSSLFERDDGARFQ